MAPDDEGAEQCVLGQRCTGTETTLSGKHDKAADPETKSELLLTGPIAIRGLGRATRDFFRPDKVTKHRAAADEANGRASGAMADAAPTDVAVESTEVAGAGSTDAVQPVQPPAEVDVTGAQRPSEPADGEDDRVPTAQIPLSWMFTGAPAVVGGESELVTAGGEGAQQPRLVAAYPAALDAAALDRLRRRMVDRDGPQDFAVFASDSEESAEPTQGSEDEIQNERSRDDGEHNQSELEDKWIPPSDSEEIVSVDAEESEQHDPSVGESDARADAASDEQEFGLAEDQGSGEEAVREPREPQGEVTAGGLTEVVTASDVNGIGVSEGGKDAPAAGVVAATETNAADDVASSDEHVASEDSKEASPSNSEESEPGSAVESEDRPAGPAPERDSIRPDAAQVEEVQGDPSDAAQVDGPEPAGGVFSAGPSDADDDDPSGQPELETSEARALSAEGLTDAGTLEQTAFDQPEGGSDPDGTFEGVQTEDSTPLGADISGEEPGDELPEPADPRSADQAATQAEPAGEDAPGSIEPLGDVGDETIPQDSDTPEPEPERGAEAEQQPQTESGEAENLTDQGEVASDEALDDGAATSAGSVEQPEATTDGLVESEAELFVGDRTETEHLEGSSGEQPGEEGFDEQPREQDLAGQEQHGEPESADAQAPEMQFVQPVLENADEFTSRDLLPTDDEPGLQGDADQGTEQTERDFRPIDDVAVDAGPHLEFEEPAQLVADAEGASGGEAPSGESDVPSVGETDLEVENDGAGDDGAGGDFVDQAAIEEEPSDEAPSPETPAQQDPDSSAESQPETAEAGATAQSDGENAAAPEGVAELGEPTEAEEPAVDEDDRWNSYAWAIDPSVFTHPTETIAVEGPAPAPQRDPAEPDDVAQASADPALADDLPLDEDERSAAPDEFQSPDACAEAGRDAGASDDLPYNPGSAQGQDNDQEPTAPAELLPDEPAPAEAAPAAEGAGAEGESAPAEPSGRAQVAFTAIAAALSAVAITAAVEGKRSSNTEAEAATRPQSEGDEPLNEVAGADGGSAAEPLSTVGLAELTSAGSTADDAMSPTGAAVPAVVATPAVAAPVKPKAPKERPPKPAKSAGPARPPRAPRGGRGSGGRLWGYIALAVLTVVCIALVIAVIVKTRHDADLAAQEAAAYTPPPLTTPSASPTPTASVPLVSVVGDEFTAGTSSDSGPKAEWPALLATALKANVKTYAATGVGYDTKGSGGATVQSEVGQVDPASTVVVLFAGTNDQSADTLSLASAATKAINAAHTRAPNAKIVVVGPASGLATAPAALTSVRDTLQSAATIGKASFKDPISGKWLSGGASLTDPNGHPTDAGERVLESKMAAALKGVL